MKVKLIALLMSLIVSTPAFCQIIGTVDFQQVVSNYAKAKNAYRDIDDRATSLQSYLLEKEKEFKKIDSPVQRKAFEEKTAKEFTQKQQALANLKESKEREVSNDIDKIIKAVALENKIDTVVDIRVIYFGGVDITDKVIKKLNALSVAK